MKYLVHRLLNLKSFRHTHTYKRTHAHTHTYTHAHTHTHLPHLLPLVHAVGQGKSTNFQLLQVQQEVQNAGNCGIHVAVLHLHQGHRFTFHLDLQGQHVGLIHTLWMPDNQAQMTDFQAIATWKNLKRARIKLLALELVVVSTGIVWHEQIKSNSVRMDSFWYMCKPALFSAVNETTGWLSNPGVLRSLRTMSRRLEEDFCKHTADWAEKKAGRKADIGYETWQ